MRFTINKEDFNIYIPKLGDITGKEYSEIYKPELLANYLKHFLQLDDISKVEFKYKGDLEAYIYNVDITKRKRRIFKEKELNKVESIKYFGTESVINEYRRLATQGVINDTYLSYFILACAFYEVKYDKPVLSEDKDDIEAIVNDWLLAPAIDYLPHAFFLSKNILAKRKNGLTLFETFGVMFNQTKEMYLSTLRYFKMKY